MEGWASRPTPAKIRGVKRGGNTSSTSPLRILQPSEVTGQPTHNHHLPPVFPSFSFYSFHWPLFLIPPGLRHCWQYSLYNTLQHYALRSVQRSAHPALAPRSARHPWNKRPLLPRKTPHSPSLHPRHQSADPPGQDVVARSRPANHSRYVFGCCAPQNTNPSSVFHSTAIGLRSGSPVSARALNASALVHCAGHAD